MEEPYLYWAAIGPDGTVTQPPEVIAEIDRGYLIHDFVITEDFVVLVICPATFDLSRIEQGANTLTWEPDRGTRIAVIPRNGQNRQIRWVETDAFWCWHYANAWQEGGEISPFSPGGTISISVSPDCRPSRAVSPERGSIQRLEACVSR